MTPIPNKAVAEGAALAETSAPRFGRRGLTPRTAVEAAIKYFCLACALLSVAVTLGIIVSLSSEAIQFFRNVVSLPRYFTGTEWSPNFSPPRYGVLPLICGTALIAVGSGLIAIPLGLLAAIYLSEYASPRARNVLKPGLELLAGIPTVVYGYFGLVTVTPVLRRVFGPENVQAFNAASGAIVVGVMILPLISSLCEDALSAVPRNLREGAYALGATKMEVSLQIVMPAALSGITAAFILAISRAVGETMAVTLAAGQTPKLTLNPGESIETMTAYIVNTTKGDVARGDPSYLALFAVGMTLFVITFVMNMLAAYFVRRFRNVYE